MRHLVIHGHFYQPPRENPWTGRIDREPSARPFPNWNSRILAECYAANRDVELLRRDPERGSNYPHLSFDFGPTLLDWLEREAHDLFAHLREADAQSLARLGHGNAMAQAYSHPILPLLSRRDKTTQVRWGLAHFRRTFGREAEGMWLPETAADLETLDVLAEEGVRFTVLSPGQLATLRPDLETPWRMAESASDVGRAYRAATSTGREIALFFYDGMLAGEISFGDLAADGSRLGERFLRAAGERTDGGPMVAVATDGETFGHHHRTGHRGLAEALRYLRRREGLEITNFAGFLVSHPPVWEARIVEPGSWSCTHGVGRWQGPCGCSTRRGLPETLTWRGYLYDAIHSLARDLDAHFEQEGGKLLRDPWAARDDYIEVLLDPERREDFAARHRRPEVREDAWRLPAGAGDPGGPGWSLLEMERYVLLSFTSCGWFFDDPAGLETRQVLRYAARALELAGGPAGSEARQRFLEDLRPMRSEEEPELDGVDLLERAVRGQG